MSWINKFTKVGEKVLWRMRYKPQVFYHRLPCKFCGEHAWEHMDDGKCLFAPTRYKAPTMGPAADAEFREQAEEKFGPRRTDELHVFFEETFDEIGVTYYLMSNQEGEDSLRSPSNYCYDLEMWSERCREWAT